jgi:hypothetical protein
MAAAAGDFDLTTHFHMSRIEVQLGRSNGLSLAIRTVSRERRGRDGTWCEYLAAIDGSTPDPKVHPSLSEWSTTERGVSILQITPEPGERDEALLMAETTFRALFKPLVPNFSNLTGFDLLALIFRHQVELGEDDVFPS